MVNAPGCGPGDGDSISPGHPKEGGVSKKSRTSGLLEKVREHILALKPRDHVTRRELADKFGARKHEIDQVMHRLNLEGLVSQAYHGHCPDRGGPNKNKCYHPDYFVVLERGTDGHRHP